MAFKSNVFGLKIGDIISYSNMKLIVRRITDKSVYLATSFGENTCPYWGEDFEGHKNSFGTIDKVSKKYKDFKIIRNPPF